ncbi:MAG: glycosyltransferase family 39 protein [Thermoflexus sp.]|nr:glycosyltransferase family 39 protein [Thermoflexus sp.]
MTGLAVPFSIGRIAFGRPIGQLALVLGVLHPYLVWFSQEVCVYGLLFTLSSLATLGLLRALRRNRWSDWMRYGLAAAAACYTHLTTLWMIAAHLALIAWEGKRLLRRTWGLLALGILDEPHPPVPGRAGRPDRSQEPLPLESGVEGRGPGELGLARFPRLAGALVSPRRRRGLARGSRLDLRICRAWGWRALLCGTHSLSVLSLLPETLGSFCVCSSHPRSFRGREDAERPGVGAV